MPGSYLAEPIVWYLNAHEQLGADGFWRDCKQVDTERGFFLATAPELGDADQLSLDVLISHCYRL